MAKRITLISGQTFATLTKAREYFDTVRKEAVLDTPLPEPLRSEVIDVYKRYCVATNYAAVDPVSAVVAWDNRERGAGIHAQTRSFYVRTEAGEDHGFSMRTALGAIAQ